ncbi:MAG: stage II sporulation protein R [Clostridia bacterium]|nr:stage II sporulation protein R [Clostridia bacterium]
MKKLLALCAVILGISVVFVSFSAKEMRDSFVRLHILANSDGEEDQQIKLALRDALLCEFSARLAEADSVDEAKSNAGDLLPDIEAFCNAFLSDSGVEYGATAILDKEYYPNRVYDNVSLPAGTYTSLRVVLGSGEGQNWWCVLFPPLCLDLAKGEEAFIAAGLSKDDYQTVTNDRSGKYEFRFKLFEIMGKIFK